MANRSGRRFHLLDAMILVAATASGIAAGRAQLSASNTPGAWWGVDVHVGSVWYAIIWALALMVVQLREGRLERRRITCRPGFAACVASLACLAVLLIEEMAMKLLLWWKPGRPLQFEWADLYLRIFPLLTLTVPCTVAATWALLAFGGRWRPARDWIDRLGFLLGLYWVSWNVLAWVLLLGV